MRITLDFETSSATDLIVCGAWKYAECVTTAILTLKIHWPGLNQPKRWVPADGLAKWLVDIASNPEVLFEAHHAGFEKATWRTLMVPLGFPDVPDERWRDTMAVCAYKALPQALEQAVSCLRLPYQKDMDGRKFTLGFSKADKQGYYPKLTPEAQKRIDNYCDLDVLAEGALSKRIGDLTDDELQVWFDNERMNQRGLKIDLEFVAAALEVVDQAIVPLLAEHREITKTLEYPDGLTPGQRDKMLAWFAERGVRLPNLTKETVAGLLGIDAEDIAGDDDELGDGGNDPVDIDLPGPCRRALEIRALINSAAIKKLKRMEQVTCADGRSRGMTQYHGTGPGRPAGRMWNHLNLPRPTIKMDPEQAVEIIKSRDASTVELLLGPAVEVVASSLRHAIIADKGKVLMAGDYAGIQARIVLAISGQHDKVALMASGKDVYCDLAEKIHGRKIDKDKDPEERMDGKAGVLGCGFQMGGDRFWKTKCQHRPKEFAHEIVRIYREDWAPCVPKLWGGTRKNHSGLMDAAVKTVHQRTAHEAYGFEYRLEDGWLSVRLPSGRKIWYWNPQATREAMPWDENDIRPSFTYQATKTKQLRTIKAFGGLLTENVVMGIERDIMTAGRRNLEREGFPVIMDAYDEAVCEVDEDKVDEKLFKQCMEDVPGWVKALRIPVAVELWPKPQLRYRK